MVPRVLTIAGSDSGGGAGIQADLKVMTAHSVYGLSVITAITSQNTLKVDAVQVVDTDMVEKQFRAVVSDLGCDSVKTGMLGNREIIEKLGDLLDEFNLERVVVDPVMVATTGASLLDHDAIESYIKTLLPRSYVLTPNISEARLLVARSRGIEVAQLPELESVDDMRSLATELQALGPKYVLVKGGHLPLSLDMSVCKDAVGKALVADVLCGSDGQVKVITSKWSSSRNTHGTGCSLASAIASNLALGKSVNEAISDAIEYIHGAIVHSFDLGSGNGPLNHMYRLTSLPFAPDSCVDYLINHPAVQPAWNAYTQHKFVQQLADGTLPLPAFKHFLVQDYLYLVHYARLNALAAYKSTQLDDIVAGAEIILHIKREVSMHLTFCESFGISKTELEHDTEESVACTVYTRYMEHIGTSKDWLSLQVALAACLIGYGEVCARLSRDPNTNKTSPYWPWIQNYVESDYTEAVNTGRALLERHARQISPSQVEEFVKIFKRVTEYETLFWTSSLEESDAANTKSM